MIMTESKLRFMIRHALIESVTKAGKDAMKKTATHDAKSGKEDNMVSLGFVKVVKPEIIERDAPRVFLSLINKGKIPPGFGEVQQKLAAIQIRESGFVKDFTQLRRLLGTVFDKGQRMSRRKEAWKEFKGTREFIMTRLSKFRGLGSIVQTLNLPDEMITDPGAGVAKSVATTAGTTAASTIVSKGAEKLIGGPVALAKDIFNISKHALKDTDVEDKIQKMIKNALVFDTKTEAGKKRLKRIRDTGVFVTEDELKAAATA